MIKHTQTLNCLSVFDHFVRLASKGLRCKFRKGLGVTLKLRDKANMAKHTQEIRRLLPTNCLSVSDYFVRLAPKGLRFKFRNLGVALKLMG